MRLFQINHLSKHDWNIYNKYLQSESIFTQFDMCLVLVAFFGTFLIYPEMYGCNRPSDEELSGFIHFWRVLGYYLGLEDKFNPCAVDSPDEARSLLKEFANHIMIPASLNMNKTAIHMGKSVTRAFGEDFHVLCYGFLYGNVLCTAYFRYLKAFKKFKYFPAHGIELKSLWNSLSFGQKIFYYFRCYFLEVIYPYWFVRTMFNKILETVLSR